MGQYFDAADGLGRAWALFRDSELLRWSAIFVLGTQGFAIPMTVAYVLGDTLGVLTIIGLLIVSILVGLLVGLYAMPRVIRAAMKAAGVPVAPSPPGLVEWAVFSFRMWFLNTFSWYDKILLLPAIPVLLVAIVLLGGSLPLIASIAAKGKPDVDALMPELLPLLGALAVGFFVIVLWEMASGIHRIRTMFAPFMFLRGDGPEREMPRKSFGLVKGQTLEVFIPLLVFGVAMMVAALPVGIVSYVAQSVGENETATAGSSAAIIQTLAFLFGQAIQVLWAWPVLAFTTVFTVLMFVHYDKQGPAGAQATAGDAIPQDKPEAKKKQAPKNETKSF